MDRLVKLVDEIVGENPQFSCIAQIGDSQFPPKNCHFHKVLNQDKFNQYAKEADVIVSHAGMGNIILAATLNKHILVMARKSSLNEHINDHQLSTVKGLQNKNFVHPIDDKQTLMAALQRVEQSGLKVINSPDSNELTNYLTQYFNSLTSKKVLAVSSAGGHWVQLKALSVSFEKHNVIFMTTNINSDETFKINNRVITVIDADLKRKFRLLLLGLQTCFYVLKSQPDIIISTGAAPGFFAIFYAKLMRKNTIWVDSIANYEKLSISGKYAKTFSDMFLVQWPHLETEGDYKGALI